MYSRPAFATGTPRNVLIRSDTSFYLKKASTDIWILDYIHVKGVSVL